MAEVEEEPFMDLDGEEEDDLAEGRPCKAKRAAPSAEDEALLAKNAELVAVLKLVVPQCLEAVETRVKRTEQAVRVHETGIQEHGKQLKEQRKMFEDLQLEVRRSPEPSRRTAPSFSSPSSAGGSGGE